MAGVQACYENQLTDVPMEDAITLPGLGMVPKYFCVTPDAAPENLTAELEAVTEFERGEYAN